MNTTQRAVITSMLVDLEEMQTGDESNYFGPFDSVCEGSGSLEWSNLKYHMIQLKQMLAMTEVPMIKVTFWSDTCAEGCTTYEEVLAKEKLENGACSTTLDVENKQAINDIYEVATQETYSELFYHIH